MRIIKSMEAALRGLVLVGLPLIAFLLLLTGCATGRIQSFQPVAQSSSERTVQESGVEVVLDPFVESERTQAYFKINAIDDGIAILHVRVTNKTADQTFLVEKKDFQLSTNGVVSGLTGDGKKIERSEAGGDAVAWVGAAGGGLVMVFAGVAMLSHSTEIQRNFIDKEMGDGTLSPGRSMEGFIYFTPVTKGKDWSRTAAVKVKLTETTTKKLIEINVPLSH